MLIIIKIYKGVKTNIRIQIEHATEYRGKRKPTVKPQWA